jgi:hypothetical protein
VRTKRERIETVQVQPSPPAAAVVAAVASRAMMRWIVVQVVVAPPGTRGGHQSGLGQQRGEKRE